MDAQMNAAAAYRRLALRALRGRFLPLTLISGASLLTGMRVTSLSARTGWLMALALVVRLFHPMLRYGRTLIFTRRFRGQPCGLDALPGWEMLPKLLGIFALRDAPGLALILLGDIARARDPLDLSGQALQAAGLLLGAALALHYCMAEYLLIDRPTLSPVAALRASRRRLSGRRFQLFTLAMGFAGWFLLAALILAVFSMAAYSASAGVLVALAYLLMLPLSAYFNMTFIAFFEHICQRRRERP